MDGGANRTPNRRQIGELRQAQSQASALAKRELGRVWSEIGDWEPEQQRDALLELVPAIIDKYADTSSVAAAEWYQRVRDKWIREAATLSATTRNAIRRNRATRESRPALRRARSARCSRPAAGCTNQPRQPAR